MIKVRIDRFEEEFAVCEGENGEFYDIKIAEFPFPLHECDILLIDIKDGHLCEAHFLREETEKKAEEVRSLMQSLRKKRK